MAVLYFGERYHGGLLALVEGTVKIVDYVRIIVDHSCTLIWLLFLQLEMGSSSKTAFHVKKLKLCQKGGWTRRRGQPPSRWLDNVEKDFKLIGNQPMEGQLMEEQWSAKGC
ncbi:hypothetical protein TNCV_2629911 [Trichonephila clavipes]|uniref:Uncharacterized protein n=1 Tax=Trichonephila clavipes TaxID=2585209 RepID=A0A8X6V9T0_TRICX|nr:hypothetical protein TNCV_2629911 [Trichonephila clavipes]